MQMIMKDVKIMTSKAYIVANEEQEREVLEKFEQQGLVWVVGGQKPTEWILKKGGTCFYDFPYVLIDEGKVSWANLFQLTDEEIVYDGRKEEQMSDKYVVSQEFMDELEEWKDELNTIDGGLYISTEDFIDLPLNILKWRDGSKYTKENNNRLIAIIRWVNGEDVFEVEKPKKWVVRSKETDEYGEYRYTFLMYFAKLVYPNCVNEGEATKFDTKEEAESWANSHQEVVEVDE